VWGGFQVEIVAAHFLGLSVGFLIAGLPLSWLLARFLFKTKDADARSSYAVAIVFFVLALLYGLGGDPNLAFSKWEGIYFAPGALIAWLILRWHFRVKNSRP
jgi:hypothetical protein